MWTVAATAQAACCLTREADRPSRPACRWQWPPAAAADSSSKRTSGPSRHNLRPRTWVTARNHRGITAPHTRTFNHGAALVRAFGIRWNDFMPCDQDGRQGAPSFAVDIRNVEACRGCRQIAVTTPSRPLCAEGQTIRTREPTATRCVIFNSPRQSCRPSSRATRFSLTYHPSVARPSMPLLVPPSIGLLRRCASTPSSNARLSRSSKPRP